MTFLINHPVLPSLAEALQRQALPKPDLYGTFPKPDAVPTVFVLPKTFKPNSKPIVRATPEISKSSKGKRCSISGCARIKVSKGLCRAHGGGKRCIAKGCTKGAQGVSSYCWGHGGGSRCLVQDCKRSRKKRGLCASHFKLWEGKDQEIVALMDENEASNN